MGFRLNLVLAISTIILVASVSNAQSRKDAKKYGIRSATVTRTMYMGTTEVSSHAEKIEKFDKEGRVIDETDFDANGAFKRRTTRKYNKAGEITEEAEWNAQGAVISKTVTVFDDSNRKVNEVTSDGSGKITEWTKYGYDTMGEKIFELELDANGKTLKKSMYTYDKNGLKKERKTFNSQDELIMIKKYQYSGTSDSD